MKFLTRTIIVLVVFSLVMGSFVLAQAEGQVEPTARRRARVPTPPGLVQPGTAPPMPTPVEPTPSALPVETFTISGTTGLSGVLMKGLPGNHVVTDASGYYSATVEHGWSGTVTPTKKGYAFEPPNLQYSRVIHDQTNQNYNPKRVGPVPMLGRTGSRKVLVIPATDVKPEDLAAIQQDLQDQLVEIHDEIEQLAGGSNY